MSTKNNIIRILENNRGNSISGEKLAETLSISRTAVWKAIKELQRDGYPIIAVTNKGYCLPCDCDMLSAEGIEPFLKDASVSESITVYKTLESTNQTAKKLALDHSDSPTIIIADAQSAGRGRMGRSFYSPAGNGIYMSFILRPRLSAAHSVLITTAASVAVCRAIEMVCGISAQIKWVNDLMLGDKKICGILTEAVTDFESGNVECIILGIGINFNLKNSSFPAELQGIAGALYNGDTNGISRNRLAAEIINQVLLISTELENPTFLDEYKSRLNILNKEIQIIQTGQITNATALDIDKRGGLIVKTQDGTVTTLHSGEISIRRR